MVQVSDASGLSMLPAAKAEFDALVRFSAVAGQDPLLIQSAGGNTSLKVGDVMWIKASGTNLGDALIKDVFVPTAWRDIAKAVETNSPEADQPANFLLGDGTLRPSIETCLHAIFEEAFVIHVHCVSTIALAVLTDGEEQIKERLAGLEWVWVPYQKPGADLSRSLYERRKSEKIAVLGNHGLLIAADSVAEGEQLLRTVCARLKCEAVNGTIQQNLTAPQAYVPLPADHVLSRAMAEPRLREIALGGNMYPDHVIFCGPRIGDAENPDGEILIADQKGAVSIRSDAAVGAWALAGCLGDVLLRMPADGLVNYLSMEDVASLMNWEAEKYRQSLNV